MKNLLSRVFSQLSIVLPAALLFAGWNGVVALEPWQDPSAGGLEIATVEGKLELIGGDKLKLKTEDGEEYFAMLTRQTSMKYSGTADVRFLRPGLLVRFVAVFDLQQGVAVKPLTEIEIFRTVRQRRMSVEQRQNQTPGIYPVKEDAEANQAGNGNLTSQKFKVVGQLAVVQAGKMRVQAGAKAVLVDLQPDTKVSVSAGDALFCLPGDEIKVTGLRNPSQKSWIQAESVEVVGLKPLGNMDLPQGQTPAKNATNNRQTSPRRGKLGDDR